jgi:hypothetical protein
LLGPLLTMRDLFKLLFLLADPLVHSLQSYLRTCCTLSFMQPFQNYYQEQHLGIAKSRYSRTANLVPRLDRQRQHPRSYIAGSQRI